MRHIEESHAADLKQLLLERFESSARDIVVRVEGAGIHWNCLVERGVFSCAISCSDYDGTPEYYTSFKREDSRLARSRSGSKLDTTAAVVEWMESGDVQRLHDHHPIVDQQERALLRLRDDLLSMQPEGAQISCELSPKFAAGFCEFFLHSHHRSCRISYWNWGPDRPPRAEFSWDDCPLFKFSVTDTQFLGLVVLRWVTDGAMPSAMRKEFPTLEIGPLADYFENGNPIEGEFMESWDYWERSCQDLPEKTQSLARAFIAAMRRKGYDRKMRAGRSMFTFILSRSRRYGLRQEQPSVDFLFDGKGMAIGASFGGAHTTIRQLSILLTPEVEQILDRLAAEPID